MRVIFHQSDISACAGKTDVHPSEMISHKPTFSALSHKKMRERCEMLKGRGETFFKVLNHS